MREIGGRIQAWEQISRSKREVVCLGDLFQECHRRFEERGIQAVIINFSSCDGWWSYVSLLIQDGLPTDLASLIMLLQMLKPRAHQYSLQKFFHQTLFTFFSDYVKSKRCILTNTKILYAHLFKTAILQSNTFIVDSLMDWYCKSNSIGSCTQFV